MKRKKISDVEKFYITGNPENLDNKALAEKVGCAVSVVDELRPVKITPVAVEVIPEVVVAPAPEPVVEENTTKVWNGPNTGDLMGKNKKYGVVVMTPAASERADELRKVSLQESGSGKYSSKNVIHKIR
jgi:hypothetical protein